VPHPKRRHHELRCFCSRKPLLATYGVDENGDLYVHVKVWKQQKLYGEVVVTHGIVKIHCRECLRWNKVVIKQPNSAELVESSEPVEAVSAEYAQPI